MSDRYLLDDQATPANGALSLGVAIIAGLLAAILAVGLVGGYLVFRRSKRPLPSGGRTMGPGDEIPIRVTGALRREGGMIHVREAKSRLLRFPLEVPAEPVASVEHAEAPAVEGEEPPAVEPEADDRIESASRARGPGRMGNAGHSGDPELVVGGARRRRPPKPPRKRPLPDGTCRPP